MTDDMPAAATRLHKKALEHGWTVEVVHGGLGCSVSLRMRRGKEALNAWWHDGSFKGAWQGWRPDPEVGGVSPRRLSSRELSAVVTDE